MKTGRLSKIVAELTPQNASLFHGIILSNPSDLRTKEPELRSGVAPRQCEELSPHYRRLNFKDKGRHSILFEVKRTPMRLYNDGMG
jgi:hypothetical protein